MQTIFSDHTEIDLEINRKNTWKIMGKMEIKQRGSM